MFGVSLQFWTTSLWTTFRDASQPTGISAWIIKAKGKQIANLFVECSGENGRSARPRAYKSKFKIPQPWDADLRVEQGILIKQTLAHPLQRLARDHPLPLAHLAQAVRKGRLVRGHG